MHYAGLQRIHAPVWRRWFAFLGGGLAWTLHLLSIYAIGEFGCVGGWDRSSWAGISLVAWMIIILSGLLLVVAVAATLIGYQDKRRDARRVSAEWEDEGGVFLSSYGSLLSGLFALIILVETLPVFAYLHGC
jgi:hypothetical protein